jgi:hypothetical protein
MADVAIPLLARGVIVSRPRVVDMLDRFDFRLRFSIG